MTNLAVAAMSFCLAVYVVWGGASVVIPAVYAVIALDLPIGVAR